MRLLRYQPRTGALVSKNTEAWFGTDLRARLHFAGVEAVVVGVFQ